MKTLMRQVLTLKQMKTGISSLARDVAVVQMPVRRIWNAVSWFTAAAVGLVALVATIVGIAWIGLALVRSSTATGTFMVGQAVALHDRWLQSGSTAIAPASLAIGPDIPDLTLAGMALVSLKTDAGAGVGDVTEAGYVGYHGCKLSLFRIAGGGGSDAFELSSHGNLQTAKWASPAFGYIAVARRLDVARFAILASVLRSMTIGNEKGSPTLTAELEIARQPCVG